MSTMTPTDAVNVLKFLERTRATESSPEGAAMLQRVESHLSAWVSKETSEPIKDGGPAFPVADWDHQTFAPKTIEETRRLLSGMSLRDYFAAKALPSVYADYCESARKLGFDEDWKMGIATDAYELADAMLKAREGGAA